MDNQAADLTASQLPTPTTAATALQNRAEPPSRLLLQSPR